MEQEAEPWQSGAAGPCLTVDSPGGPVEPWLLGQQRFRLTAPSGEQVVEGSRTPESLRTLRRRPMSRCRVCGETRMTL
jgi:hypothetical protein